VLTAVPCYQVAGAGDQVGEGGPRFGRGLADYRPAELKHPEREPVQLLDPVVQPGGGFAVNLQDQTGQNREDLPADLLSLGVKAG
jgi:hypothetical protein